MDGSQPRRRGELHPDDKLNAAPPADTRRVFSASTLAGLGARNCACTFYLVFKEPAFRVPPLPPTKSSLGEPYEHNRHSTASQPLFSMRPNGVSTGAGPTEMDERWNAERTKNLLHTQNLEQIVRPARPGHAQSDNYTIRSGPCQPRHVRPATELSPGRARPAARRETRTPAP